MRKLKMPKQQLNNFEDVFHIFEASQNASLISALIVVQSLQRRTVEVVS